MYMFLGVPLPGVTPQSSMPPAMTSASAVGTSLQPTYMCIHVHVVYIYLFNFVVLFIFIIGYPLVDQSPVITQGSHVGMFLK